MRLSLADTVKRNVRIRDEWQRLRPHKSFGGLTLEQFNEIVQKVMDIMAGLETLDTRRLEQCALRDEALAHCNEAALRVVWGARGDPEEGDDGELYGGFGYVRKNKRKSGLTRRRKT